MKFSKDLWVIAVLLLFTVAMAYWASLQQPVCEEEPPERPSLLDITPWPVKLAVLQMGAALLLAIFTLSRRFVQPVPYTAEQVRVRVEYLSSMAQLFQKVQASRLALELLSAQFRRDLSSTLGLPPTVTPEELVRALAAQRPELAAQVEELFREEAEVAAQPEESRVLKLAQRMAQLRKEWGFTA